MTAELKTHAEMDGMTAGIAYGVAEAAARLGVSERTIRRQAAALGVKRIAGPAVAGFVVWPTAIVTLYAITPVAMPYYA